MIEDQVRAIIVDGFRRRGPVRVIVEKKRNAPRQYRLLLACGHYAYVHASQVPKYRIHCVECMVGTND